MSSTGIDADRADGASRDPTGAFSGSEDELAERFSMRLRFFAARRLGNVTAAEDVAQETLRRVLIAMREHRIADLAALPGFVFETARHICQHLQRTAGREERAMERLRLDGPDSHRGDALAALVSAERRATVQQALALLDPADRELLHLTYWQQLATEALARHFDTTPGAVRVRKHRALRRLAALVAQSKVGNDFGDPAT